LSGRNWTSTITAKTGSFLTVNVTTRSARYSVGTMSFSSADATNAPSYSGTWKPNPFNTSPASSGRAWNISASISCSGDGMERA
jgi:hypothetical protein